MHIGFKLVLPSLSVCGPTSNTSLFFNSYAYCPEVRYTGPLTSTIPKLSVGQNFLLELQITGTGLPAIERILQKSSDIELSTKWHELSVRTT